MRCWGRSLGLVSLPARTSCELQLQFLQTQPEPSVQGAPSGGLLPVSAEHPVPCDVCGCYFPSRRIMLTHRSRKHLDAFTLRPTLGLSLTDSYTRHTIDGMSTCRHCGDTFKRVDALKKHLKTACPALFSNRTPENPTSEHGAQVPPVHEGLHMGHSCRAASLGTSRVFC